MPVIDGNSYKVQRLSPHKHLWGNVRLLKERRYSLILYESVGRIRNPKRIDDYIVGDTFARSEVTGKDEYFRFIIHKGKVTSENTITLEAEGDPSVFNMAVEVLRADEGKMIELVKYALNDIEVDDGDEG